MNKSPTPKRRYNANLVRNPETRIRTELLQRVQKVENKHSLSHTDFTERAYELYIKFLETKGTSK